MADRLENLLRACGVWVFGGSRPIMGFFVAPGQIVIAPSESPPTDSRLTVRWEHEGQFQERTVLSRPALGLSGALAYLPGVVILRVDGFKDHPCVSIDPRLPPQNDHFLAFGARRPAQAAKPARRPAQAAKPTVPHKPGEAVKAARENKFWWPASMRDLFTKQDTKATEPAASAPEPAASAPEPAASAPESTAFTARSTGFTPVSLSFVGTQGISPAVLLEMESDITGLEVTGAVLNLNSGDVCGIALPDNSGRPLVIPWSAIYDNEALSELIHANQIAHRADSRWANAFAAEPGSSSDEPTSDEDTGIEAITTLKEFGKALNTQRLYAQLTSSAVATKAQLSKYAVAGYFVGRHLPRDSETLKLVLEACDIRSSWQLGQWHRAWERVWSQRVLVSKYGKDKPDLLFRIYIPSARLYADEAERLLTLFREWLITTRGHGVRQSGYRTASGQMYEFFADQSVIPVDLQQELDHFSNFLTLCTEDPAVAVDLLAATTLDRGSSEDLVARFARDVNRLHLDLQEERDKRILNLGYSLQRELLEAGVVLRQVPSRQIRDLLERLVPGPSAAESLAVLALPRAAQPTAPVTVNFSPQIISAMESTIIQNVQGTVHLSPSAQQLLALIYKHGRQKAAALESDVYELEDADARPADRSAAERRLRKFIGQLAGTVKPVVIDFISKYLESKAGLPGRSLEHACHVRLMSGPGGWPRFAHARRVAALSRCGELPGVRASAAAAVRCRGKASGRRVVRRGSQRVRRARFLLCASALPRCSVGGSRAARRAARWARP
jgi:hypothetical protein